MGQLDVVDLEACFPSGYNMQQVDGFLRTCGLYLFQNGEVIKDGDTMDGPGGVHWRGFYLEDGVWDPPRRVLRWFPLDGSEAPQRFLERKREQ